MQPFCDILSVFNISNEKYTNSFLVRTTFGGNYKVGIKRVKSSLSTFDRCAK